MGKNVFSFSTTVGKMVEKELKESTKQFNEATELQVDPKDPSFHAHQPFDGPLPSTEKTDSMSQRIGSLQKMKQITSEIKEIDTQHAGHSASFSKNTSHASGVSAKRGSAILSKL